MRAHKRFCVIAYDSASSKRRQRIVKALEPYGRRINYSVYECMLTAGQELKLLSELEKLVVRGKDMIVVYRICVDCFSKITYIPYMHQDADMVTVLG